MGLDGPDPLMGLCPSRSATALRCTPDSSQATAAECRSVCSPTCSTPAASAATSITQWRIHRKIRSSSGGTVSVVVSQPGQEEGGVVLMARRIAAQPAEVSGIRGALIVDLEAALNRLIGADSEIYDFSWERDWLAEKLRDLRAGCNVYVSGWRLPREHRPAAAELFWLRGDEVHPADDILSADPNDKG